MAIMCDRVTTTKFVYVEKVTQPLEIYNVTTMSVIAH